MAEEITQIVREILERTGKQTELANALAVRYRWKKGTRSAEAQLCKMLTKGTANRFPADALLDVIRVTGRHKEILGALMAEQLRYEEVRRPKRVRVKSGPRTERDPATA